jgi:hypothetical protein
MSVQLLQLVEKQQNGELQHRVSLSLSTRLGCVWSGEGQEALHMWAHAAVKDV